MICVAFAVLGFSDFDQSLTRFDAPGSVDVVVDAPGHRRIYTESGPLPGGMIVNVLDPSGVAVPTATGNVHETYTFNGRSGSSITGFHATRAGTYTVEAVAGPGGGTAQLAVGQGLGGGNFFLFMAPFFVCGCLAGPMVLAGFVLGIIGFAKRREAPTR